MENEEEIFVDDIQDYNKKIKPEAVPKPDIGADLEKEFLKEIADAGISSTLDMSALNNFTQVGQNRDLMYTALDSMCQDCTISAVLRTFAEDATERNEEGDIVWATSDDGDASKSKYINYLLRTLQINKNIYKWVYSLCKYGDVYLQLFRKSEYDDALAFENGAVKKKNLNEQVKVKAFSKNDKYIHFVEMMPNPAEMFELTKFGKTAGFIKADVTTSNFQINKVTNMPIQQYKFNQQDITIFSADKFVHAALESDIDRNLEEVTIVLDPEKKSEYSYSVRCGEALFYNVFKVWRELSLLENSILLNRVTKSSVVRLVKVTTGDMPKENITSHLYGVKAMFEQKEAINVNNSMSEYTNPGPIENNVYVPIGPDGKGNIEIESVGGDFNASEMPDVKYFLDKMLGSLGIPKQFMGILDDNAGFSGGESLARISSRYAKSIKRIQNTILEALTTLVNLFLIDKGMDSYVNTFTLHMMTPATQEELDRQENETSKIQVTRDVMDLLNDIEDPSARLKILKKLLSEILADDEISAILEEEIQKMEDENISEPQESIDEFDEEIDETSSGLDSALGLEDEEIFEQPSSEVTDQKEIENELPSPTDLGVDFTDNTNTEFEEQ